MTATPIIFHVCPDIAGVGMGKGDAAVGWTVLEIKYSEIGHYTIHVS